jgi:hypothetical protein
MFKKLYNVNVKHLNLEERFLGRYKIEFDIDCDDYIASALNRTFEDEIYSYKSLNVELHDVHTDDEKINIDAIKIILSQLKIDQSIPDDAIFELKYLYSLDANSNNNRKITKTRTAEDVQFKTVYTDSIRCITHPNLKVNYIAPLFELYIGRRIQINNITVTKKKLEDTHIIFLGAIEYWALDDNVEVNTVVQRNEKHHFGINGYTIIKPKVLMKLACDEIIKRLDVYLKRINVTSRMIINDDVKGGAKKKVDPDDNNSSNNNNIKSSKEEVGNDNECVVYTFTNETVTIPILLKGAYYRMFNPQLVTYEEHPYELKRFDFKIVDVDVDTKYVKVIEELIKTFNKIKDEFDASKDL